ncbi:hypothetical protein ACLOAU_02575 [Niabella sp. CJ426]|uniref:hypothetical protein n=1 Tax=Niabella sp. CJ426 TaxID=3393740 RepID=UPI003D02E14C
MQVDGTPGDQAVPKGQPFCVVVDILIEKGSITYSQLNKDNCIFYICNSSSDFTETSSDTSEITN